MRACCPSALLCRRPLVRGGSWQSTAGLVCPSLPPPPCSVPLHPSLGLNFHLSQDPLEDQDSPGDCNLVLGTTGREAAGSGCSGSAAVTSPVLRRGNLTRGWEPLRRAGSRHLSRVLASGRCRTHHERGWARRRASRLRLPWGDRHLDVRGCPTSLGGGAEPWRRRFLPCTPKEICCSVSIFQFQRNNIIIFRDNSHLSL